MYAKYTYAPGSSQVDIANDLIAMLTGETNKANLSGACVQADTEILTTYTVAGWIMHDAAAGTNAKVIKAPCEGDAAQFKYVKLKASASNVIYYTLWDSWNEVAHTGGNLATYSNGTEVLMESGSYSTIKVGPSVTENGEILLFANSYGILMYNRYYTGSAWYTGSAVICLEGTRDCPLFQVGTGYLPAITYRTYTLNNSSVGGSTADIHAIHANAAITGAYICKTRSPLSGLDESGTSLTDIKNRISQIGIQNSSASGTDVYSSYGLVKVSASGSISYSMFQPTNIGRTTLSNYFKGFGLYGMGRVPTTIYTGDEISYDGKTYVLIGISYLNTILNGYVSGVSNGFFHCLAAPKG